MYWVDFTFGIINILNMKLSIKEKAGYSIGEIAGSGFWQTMMIFLPIFYAETFGLSPGAIATLFIVVRIFDALNDPIMGTISDRTNTRWGKFRPFLLWGAIPMSVFTVLMFSTPDFSDGGKLAYAYVTYFMVLVMYTFLMVPYNSLLGVMTSDGRERSSLSNYKFIFAYVVTIAVQGLVWPLVDILGKGNKELGFKLTITCMAVLSAIALVIAFLSTKERIHPDPKAKSSLKDDFSDIVKNRPYHILFGVSLVFLIYIAIRGGVTMFYFKYYVGNEQLASPFMVMGTLAVIAGVFMNGILLKHFEKRTIFVVCTLVVSGALFLNYLAKPEQIVFIFTTQIIYSLASGPGFPILWTMLADAADYSEWKTGRRATGLIYSAATFGQKTGAAVGASLIMLILPAFGYLAPDDTIKDLQSSVGGIRNDISELTEDFEKEKIDESTFMTTVNDIQTAIDELQPRLSEFNSVLIAENVPEGVTLNETVELLSDIEESYNTLYKKVEQPQSKAALQGIRAVMTLVPGLIAILGALLLLFYSLSNAKLKEINEDLTERRKKIM